MNEIIASDLPFGNNELTMTSLQIAEHTGKRHDHVMRDIEKLLNDLDMGLPRFEETYIHPQNNQEYPCYRLPIKLTHNLILGYSAKMRQDVLDYIEELENEKQSKELITLTPVQKARLLLDAEIKVEKLQIEYDKAIETKAQISSSREAKALSDLGHLAHLKEAERLCTESHEYCKKMNAIKPDLVGQVLNTKCSAIKVNKYLCELGYQQLVKLRIQVKIKGVAWHQNTKYTYTDEGKLYGCYKMDQAGTRNLTVSLRWKPDIIRILNEHIAKLDSEVT